MSNEELAIRAREGDTNALLALWSQVKRFAFRQAHRWYYGYGAVGIDDYVQASFLALVDAVTRYDPAGGAFLPLYANRIRTEFRVAKFGGRSKRVELDPIHNCASLNVPVGDEEDGDALSDFIVDEYAAEAFDRVEYIELAETLRDALQALSNEERCAIHFRYWSGLTQAQAAQRMDLTEKELRRIEASALRKLRHPSVSKTLREYLY